MTHRGVGAVVSLALVLRLGPVTRFANRRKVLSYRGLNPSQGSSGGRQRLGGGPPRRRRGVGTTKHGPPWRVE